MNLDRAVAICLAAGVVAALPSAAGATSQWTRKYGVGCTTCHTNAFPRLNYYGEQFQRNGYQDLGTEDGDEAGKQAIGARLSADEIGNFFGVRLNIVPVRVVTNDLETGPGDFDTRVDFGSPNWLQLFTAGSIFKNVSIFIETEIPFDGNVHTSWFRLGVHNLFGTPALNIWTGVLDPLELHAASGRLPMIPPVRQEVFYVRSSNGAGDGSLNLRGGRPAISAYGSAGPLVYHVGVDNGPALQDTNTAKNVWGTLRGELPEGVLEGSSISVWGNWGRDSLIARDATGAFTDEAENDFWRVSPAANLRWQDLDVIAAWVYGRDDNWTLAFDGAQRNVFHGLLLQAGYAVREQYHVAAQLDRIWSDDTPALELQKLALAFSYLPREHWRAMVIPRLDLLGVSSAHPRRNHEALLAIRTMF
jgi:hypothetical protein